MKKNIEDIREESKKSAQIYEREITKKMKNAEIALKRMSRR